MKNIIRNLMVFAIFCLALIGSNAYAQFTPIPFPNNPQSYKRFKVTALPPVLNGGSKNLSVQASISISDTNYDWVITKFGVSGSTYYYLAGVSITYDILSKEVAIKGVNGSLNSATATGNIDSKCCCYPKPDIYAYFKAIPYYKNTLTPAFGEQTLWCSPNPWNAPGTQKGEEYFTFSMYPITTPPHDAHVGLLITLNDTTP